MSRSRNYQRRRRWRVYTATVAAWRDLRDDVRTGIRLTRIKGKRLRQKARARRRKDREIDRILASPPFTNDDLPYFFNLLPIPEEHVSP